MSETTGHWWLWLVCKILGHTTPHHMRGTWFAGRWWRAVDSEGNLWCESSDEAEVRSMARPGDRVQRLYNFTTAEWRDEN